MEQLEKNGFCEMTEAQMTDIDGGIVITIGATIIVLSGKALAATIGGAALGAYLGYKASK